MKIQLVQNSPIIHLNSPKYSGKHLPHNISLFLRPFCLYLALLLSLPLSISCYISCFMFPSFLPQAADFDTTGEYVVVPMCLNATDNTNRPQLPPPKIRSPPSLAGTPFSSRLRTNMSTGRAATGTPFCPIWKGARTA